MLTNTETIRARRESIGEVAVGTHSAQATA